MVKVWCKFEQNWTKAIKVIEQSLKCWQNDIISEPRTCWKQYTPLKPRFAGGTKRFNRIKTTTQIKGWLLRKRWSSEFNNQTYACQYQHSSRKSDSNDVNFMKLILFSSTISMVIQFELLHDKTNKMTCAKPRLRSAWVFVQYDRSLRCALNVKLRTQGSFMRMARLWSDWVDAQTDLSLHWAHRSFCWFCRAAAHIANSLYAQY